MTSRGLCRCLLVACLATILVPCTALGQAVPRIELSGPSEVGQGETFSVEVTLANVGDQDGSVFFVDIVVPTASVDLLSAGFLNAISAGSSITFDSLGRALHPFLTKNGDPQVVKSSAGDLLWVSVDQLHETAFAGATNRLEADFRMGRSTPPGNPVEIRFRGGFLRAGPGRGPVVSDFEPFRVTATAVTLEEVAASLASDPVFSSPAAETPLSESDERRLETQIADARTPVFLAVLPASAGAPQAVLESLVRLSGLAGTFAVLVGDRYRASSDRIAAEELDAILASSADDDPGTVLSEFVRGVDELVANPESTDAATTATPEAETEPAEAVSSRDEGDGSALPWIVAGAVVGAIALLGYGRHLRNRRRLVAQLRDQVEEDATALGTSIAELDLDVEMPDVGEAAKRDYEAALSAYEEVSGALGRARDPKALRALAVTIRKGREAIERTQEALTRPP